MNQPTAKPTEGAQGSANSGTPKTDTWVFNLQGVEYVNANVARQLERQLAQSEERVKELEGALQLMLNQADANPDFCRTYTPESRETARALLSSSKTN